ncbi:hypothetical protein BO94DRAFT_532025 [Aspergillus sclerotioniger CBS 115572]|uniref:AB hydrolase-1 domain-containing protein n=1 Tax=Aspergillus sclerotioniger CBS 115572 TaxID=1450535 RepID=A0A317X6V5_9EURO|nr:hypothetical protein BO94DRAFT_532025 [Aspergillus sclerotioniger CBS 115572]PWY94065.1 hypothetical protein BO94DRAFT_532025 [Aspergillus sclerotioniger CBS 115572]
MPRPLVGIGHSYGGNIITNLAYIHPRLFTTVLLLDPVIQTSLPPMGFGTDPTGTINFSLWRQDVWPNRAAAAQAHRTLTKSWDPRCAERMIKYAFRDLPTPLHPGVHAANDTTTNQVDSPVTLTTTKYHDVIAQIRQNFSSRIVEGRMEIDRTTHADLDTEVVSTPMYRPEAPSTYYRLPTLRPSCLWVLGAKTYLRLDEMREGIRTCGCGVGGSGGVAQARVKEVIMSGLGHLFPFQDVGRSAETCAAWLETEMERYRVAEKEWKEKRQLMSKRDHLVLTDEWFKVLRPPRQSQSKKMKL